MRALVLLAATFSGLIFCPVAHAQQLPAGVYCESLMGVPTIYGNMQTPKGANANLQAQLKDGITVAEPDMFAQPSTIATLMSAADTLGMKVAPHLDLSYLYRVANVDVPTMEAAAIKALSEYATMAQQHPCALRTSDGRLVVFVYGTWQLPADAWQYVFAQCALGGDVFYAAGATNGNGLWPETWSFGPGISGRITTVMPGYKRKKNDGLPLPLTMKPDGGKRYRAEWASASTPVVLIDTWNGTGDGSQICGKLEKATAAGAAAWRKRLSPDARTGQ